VLEHARVERAVLAGHSMGAYAVARLAADHPERAAAVVLVDGGIAVCRRAARVIPTPSSSRSPRL